MSQGQRLCRQCRRFRKVPGGFAVLSSNRRDPICRVCRRSEAEDPVAPPPRAEEPDPTFVRCRVQLSDRAGRCGSLVFRGREGDHLRDNHGISDATAEEIAASFGTVLRGGDRLEVNG